jgi:hypothetical protein
LEGEDVERAAAEAKRWEKLSLSQCTFIAKTYLHH